MNIGNLRDAMRNIHVQGTIDSIGEARTVNLRAGGQSDVAEAVIRDESGSIPLTLWNEQIEQVKKGSVVDVMNGYTNSFNGSVRLNVGKFGKLTTVAIGSDLDEPQFGEV